MKTLFRSLLALVATCLLGSTMAQAQTIPNGTLDNWAVRNGNDAPVNWLVTNDLLPFLIPFPGLTINNVTKSTTARTGPFAAQLQTGTLAGILPVQGIMVLGNRVGSANADIPGGLPFTGRPAQFQFDYRLTGANALNDSASVIVQLTRTTGGITTVIGQAFMIRLQPAAAYTTMTLPIQYVSTAQPDTVRIAFASGGADTVTPGTTLLVDNVSFGTGTGTRDAALAAAISVSPNPSPDGRYLISSTEPGLLTAPLTVFDLAGRVVRRETAFSPATPTSRSLDLSGLPTGLYTMQLATSRGVVTQKLVR